FNNFTGEIIGVVRNTRHLALDMAPTEEVYAAYLQAPFWGTMALTVRTASNPLGLSRAVREQVSAIDKSQPVSKVRTMDEVIDASVSAPRFRTLLRSEERRVGKECRSRRATNVEKARV